MALKANFLDLPGELRNAIYTYFLLLKPDSTDAINLVNTHEQVHDEFAPLFMSPSNRLCNFAVDFRELNNYLHVFFIKRPHASPQTINRHVFISLRAYGIGEERKIDLLRLVKVLKEFPSFRMNFHPGRIRNVLITSYMVEEIRSAVLVLRNMDTRKAERVVSAELEIFMPNENQREAKMRPAVFVNITGKRRAEKVSWNSRLRPRQQEHVGNGLIELGFTANFKLLKVRITWED
ncbi:hypothetical protein J4E91_006501 [Alternaria rosae]|nr:hypothetical protein J4E91_006501 [Alternaria rosae]